MRIGKRPQQNAVDHREDGGVGTHTQREGENRQDRDTQIVAELTEGEPQIVEQTLHGWVSSGTQGCFNDGSRFG